MVKNDVLRGSWMVLFVGIAILLLLVQWRTTAASTTTTPVDPLPPPPPVEPQTQPIEPTQTVDPSPPLSDETHVLVPLKQVLGQLNTSKGRTEENASVTRFLPVRPDAANRLRLVVDLSDRRVYVYQGKKLQTSYPVAIGQEGWETPIGLFQVTEKQKNPVWRHPITDEVVKPGPKNPLGSRWIGFWSDGRHFIGFHGTPKPHLVGQRVSHGCLRMRNSDIQTLYEQVSFGTSVTVRY